MTCGKLTNVTGGSHMTKPDREREREREREKGVHLLFIVVDDMG